MKYKVGDKVKLMDYFGIGYDKFNGEIVTISQVEVNGYYVEENSVFWVDADINCLVEEFSSIKELIKLEEKERKTNMGYTANDMIKAANAIGKISKKIK